MSTAYEHSRRYAARNPDKKRAHWTVGAALRWGRLQKQPCEKCGAEPAQAHHDDYSKPLEVRWLCRAHHIAHHAADPNATGARWPYVRPTHCKRGHELTAENTISHVQGRRRCRLCFNMRAKKYRDQSKA